MLIFVSWSAFWFLDLSFLVPWFFSKGCVNAGLGERIFIVNGRILHFCEYAMLIRWIAREDFSIYIYINYEAFNK